MHSSSDLPCAQQFAQRHLVLQRLPGPCPVALYGLELRRFVDAVADEQADDDEHGAGEERQAPAPGQEIRFRQPRHQRERAHGQQDAERRAHQRQAAEEGFPLRRRVFHRHQHGSAHFAAERQALSDVQDDQQHRRGDADLFIGRQQSDEHGAYAHQQQAQRQHGFAADAVAEVAEQDAANRPCQHAAGERAEGRERARHRIELREEDLVEYQCGGGAVGEEVEGFHRGADDRCDGDPEQVRFLVGRAMGSAA